MKLSTYQANGFYLLSPIDSVSGLREYPVAASVTIVKGDYCIFASGYVTNTATAVQLLLVAGIAAEDADNSAGAAGAINVKIIPLLPQYQFTAPVAANAVIGRANVGVAYDLEANDDLDISDTTITAGSKAFWVDDYDASAAAVAANTYGYAIGHFDITNIS